MHLCPIGGNLKHQQPEDAKASLWKGSARDASDSAVLTTKEPNPLGPVYNILCYFHCSLCFPRDVLCYSREVITEIALTNQSSCTLNFDLLILLKQINNTITSGDHPAHFN